MSISKLGPMLLGAVLVMAVSAAGATGGVRINPDGSVELGTTVGQGVEMEGFAVINGEVFVDGEKVPRGKKTVVSKKTGKTYRIEWGKHGNVSVTEQ